MFNKILIVYSEKLTENHLDVVEKVKNILAGKNLSVIKFSDLHTDYFKDIDLVVTIGGDGTFLRTSHFLRNNPILGINSEPKLSEGALTTLNATELEQLNDILNGNYKIMQRPRARIIKNNKLIGELALNEVYVGSANQFHTSRYIIKFNNREEEQRSSGVLVVTGSGSKAWYRSAGGKPFNHNDEKLAFLVREPYFGNLFNPKILNGEIKEGEKIAFESKRNNGGVIAIDSWPTYNFNKGDIVEVRLSSQPLNVIVKNDKEN